MRNWQQGDDPEADRRSAILLQSAINILTRKDETMAKKPTPIPEAQPTRKNVRMVRKGPDPKLAEREAKKAEPEPTNADKAFEQWANTADEPSDEVLDNSPPAGIKSGFSVFNPQPQKEITMSRKPKQNDGVIKHEDGYTETINPLPEKEPTKQELKAAEAQAKLAAKAAKLAEREAKKAEREAAKAAKVTTTAEERAANKAEREARLAALNPDGKRTYTGSMLALADRVKQGAYVKGATGQLRSTNELAEALDAVPVDNVIRLAKQVLGLEANPYVNLNTGQQSMNLRNLMRGAIKKGTLTIATIRETIEAEGYATATDWAAEREAKKAEREARAAAAKAAKSAAAAEKAKAKAAAEAENAAVAEAEEANV